MNKFDIYKSFLYKWRYWIGYGLIAIILIAGLTFSGMFLPGGISNDEMQSIVKSNNIGFNVFNIADITNLPYHLLQHASIAIFGVSIISIKLPTIILAMLSAFGLVLLLRRWFKPSIGVLASLIAITTGQFLFIAQDGTSSILYLFWPVCLLLIANVISYQKSRNPLLTIAFFAVAALSLYTPLSLYVLLALAFAAVLHPRLRYLIRKIPRLQLIISLLLAVAIAVPLALATLKSPKLLLALLGIPKEMPNFAANFASLGAQYFGFSKPGGLTIMTPFFDLGSMLIIAIGIYHVLKTRITAKNYVITLWLLCLIPAVILNPTFTGITFLPLVLLLSTGLNTLLMYWYKLFPRNPYARVGGLIPTVALVIVLIFSGVSHFINGYEYDPTVVNNFSKDLNLIPKNTQKIVVEESELAFYKVVAANSKNNLQVSTMADGNYDSFLATHKANRNFTGYKVIQIMTSSMKSDSDRFYLYTKTTN